MSSAREWVVKTDRYGGSIAGYFATKSAARQAAKDLNEIYHSDEYHVEEWKETPNV